MKKRILALLLTLSMVLSLFPRTALAASGSETEEPQAKTGAVERVMAGEGVTALAFTSDVHNGTAVGSETNVSAIRMQKWLDNVQPKYSNAIQVMGFCGDMGAGGNTNASSFWTYTKTVMDLVVDNGMTGVYAVGNHEYMNGSFATITNAEVQGKYVLNAEGRAVAGESYVMYCLGTNSSHGSSWAYDESQVTELADYLNRVSNDKVVIILTHFPLHNYGMHRTSNTLPVLNAINTAAVGPDGTYGTSDDKKIVFLWGHNHSEGDTNYDQVWVPGDKINDDNKSTVYFFYAAAGSMADSEYGSSGKVLGKGLVMTINSKNQLSFAYYDANGNNVTEPNGQAITEQDPEPITGATIPGTTETGTSGNLVLTKPIKVGKSAQLSVSVQPSNSSYDINWSSNNTAIATVDNTGYVTGVSAGTVTITANIIDKVQRASLTLNVEVEITDAGGSEEYTVSVTPSTSNPEQSITIDVGDTLIVNVTNGSTNSTYNFTASLGSSNGVAEIQGESTVNIAAGGTGQFIVEGLAEGKVDITIQNSNTYGSQYARKATIHLTVGDGSSTPVDPPTGDTISITPSTDNPEQSIKINVGDTLTINVTNGSSNSGYDFTATLGSSNGVAQIQGNATVNIAAGSTGQFTVKGLAEGTVDITIQNNQSSSSYVRKGTIHLTVGDGGSTPVDPPTGDSVSITPTTDNPEQSIKINVGDTLAINVTNGSSNSAYDFTATLGSNNGVAQIEGNATVNIAAGGTGQFTVKGLAEGTVDITIQNENTYGSQYVRKGTIHLTVAEGDTSTVNVKLDQTSLSLKTGQTATLTATVTPSSLTDKTVTWSSSAPAVASVDSTGKVTALAAGTTTVTATSNSDPTKSASCTVTVKEAGATTVFELAEELEDGKDYLIASGNSGTVYLLTTESGGSRILKGLSASVVDGKITLEDDEIEKTAFTAELRTSAYTGGTVSAWLKNGGQYLYTNSGDGLRMVESSEQGSSDNSGKVWHYKADGKNLLWYFKDTNSSDGYTDTSGTYKYFLKLDSSNNFTDDHASSTSLAKTNTPAIYLFTEVTDHVHNWGEPEWNWTGDVEKRAAVGATATFTCSECGEVKVIEAEVSEAGEVGSRVYTATVTGPDGQTYTDTRNEKAPSAAYTIYVTADKTKVQPGDTVTFTITLGPVDNFGTMQMRLSIPDGLAYVANSGKLVDGLKETLRFDDAAFIESSLVINGMASAGDYSSQADTPIATFKCTVNEDFTGPASVDLIYLQFYSCVDWTNYTSLYSVESDTITLADTFTVTFKANDGASTADVTQSVVGGEETALNANPFTREGYTFNDWNTAANGSGTAYADKAKVTLAADLTLYAQWTPIEYTITYNLDGGTNAASNPASYTIQSAAITLADPTKEGYIFGGWYDNAQFTGTAVTEIAAGSTGAKTFYAKWTAKVFTITFVDDDGETVLHTQEAAYGETIVYSGTTPTKAATAQYTYTFAGWDPELATVTGDATYKAKYNAVVNTYTITWKNDDGTVLETDLNVEYGATPSYDGEAPTKAATAQYTYTFAGWDPTPAAVTGDATYTATYTTKENVYEVSGSVTSFVSSHTADAYKIVTIELYGEDAETPLKTATVTGTSAEFTLNAVPAGTYTLKVSKPDHAARTLSLTVGTQDLSDVDVVLHLLGDITGDGRVTTIDMAMANWFATGVKEPDAYQLACADLNGNGEVSTVEVALINSHAKRMIILWDALAEQP